MAIDSLVKVKRDEILKVAARHGVTNVKVFGSAARGEITDKSDIDFLVETGEVRSSFFPGGLIADLEELLGRRVDVVEPDGLHWFVRDRILKEAVLL
ncbi:MAG: nucleotidyltransferase family protein [Deltaproteobacteria bacterium]|nr:nucleotidyltransferase family protein [Deltaproteobacteria bacterium]MBW2084739.1 nucleotidyltransferase family protein [Deltaproteobacteria bacterium]